MLGHRQRSVPRSPCGPSWRWRPRSGAGCGEGNQRPARVFGTAGPARHLVMLVALAGLVGCNGGGSGGSDPTEDPPPGGSDSWTPGVFMLADGFAAQCESPRSGIDPNTGQFFPDIQGSTFAENNWLRSWSNDLYLWYNEITDRDPALHATPEYFDLLKTFETTASGAEKDKFHFTLSTEEWQAFSQSGVSVGYGAQWVIISGSPPRQLVVATTEPDSPATTAPVPIARGATVLEVDGVDLVNTTINSEIDTLNAGLFPSQAGETHDFTILDLGAMTPRTVTLEAVQVISTPVQNVKTIATATGAVGYMLFNDHIAPSEQALIDAVNQLLAADIEDLVLDVRYNGGGLLDIASELAYMIAGDVPTAGQTFERVVFNDKHPPLDPIPFHTTALGFSATQGQPLPALDLPRVYVLTGPNTCSASESIINGLQGVDVEVIQIGSTTCGKPYGFFPADNCGTTYFSIQIKGINAKDFGDYTDGFSPGNTVGTEGTPTIGCSVADDFTHALGDADEGRFAAALAYRNTQTCPTPTGFGERGVASAAATAPLSATDGLMVKSPWLENRSLSR